MADIKRWRRGGLEFRVYTHEKLGLYIRRVNVPSYFTATQAYLANNNDGSIRWTTKQALEKRKKLGHPARRKPRRVMIDSMFSLEEMELASSIMEELSDG